MLKKHRVATVLLSLGLTIGLMGGTVAQAAATAEAPAAPAKKEWLIPTGEHWSKGTEMERRAYLLGALNMAMIEYQLSGPNPKHRTTVAKLVHALDGMTVPQIAEKVDAYYKANPDQQQRPVFEVIWFQLVAPKASVKPAKSN